MWYSVARKSELQRDRFYFYRFSNYSHELCHVHEVKIHLKRIEGHKFGSINVLSIANARCRYFLDSDFKVIYFVSIFSGIPHGHTGHVRFLTCVETITPPKPDPRPKVNRYSLKSNKAQQNNINRGKLLVISGGDGYEDFRGPQASAELQAGREDSTNHLLLWKVWSDLARPSVRSIKNNRYDQIVVLDFIDLCFQHVWHHMYVQISSLEM